MALNSSATREELSRLAAHRLRRATSACHRPGFEERKGIRSLIAGTWGCVGIKRKAQALNAVGTILLGCDFEPILRLVQRFASLPAK
jgi:hypothetical protein